MFCHKCGKEIEDGSAFCPYCGTKMPQDVCEDEQPKDACTDIVPVETDLADDTRDENEQQAETPIVVDTLNQDDSYQANDTHNRRNYRGTVSMPKIIHDINLGKSTVICFFALLIVVLISVCVVKCGTNKSEVSYRETDEEERTTPPSYENEDERWDAENCVYANFKYGIAFTLRNDLAWHKVAGTAKHTVVKFVQPDTQLTIFVNINPIDGKRKVNDIWEVYDEYVQLTSTYVVNAVKHNSPETIEDFIHMKAEICGKHAIKVRYTSIYGDDRHEEKRRIVTTDYTFFHNNATTILAIKCDEELFNMLIDEGVSMDDFLKSFQLTPISK